LSTLVYRGKATCDSNTLSQELKLLHSTFQNSGYNRQQILQALSLPKRDPPQRREEPTSVAFIPYVGTTFSRISRLLLNITSR
jgi:hypothetical protein